MLIFDPPCPGKKASAQWTDFTFFLSQCHWNFLHWLDGGSKSPIPKKRERKSHTLPWEPIDHISSQFFESGPKSFFLLVICLCPYQYSMLSMLCLCLCVCVRERTCLTPLIFGFLRNMGYCSSLCPQYEFLATNRKKIGF